MYRQGLGDCFLVTFDPGGKEAHLLIDCGTLGATTTGVKMDAVVDDILKTTGNHLHLLVATHEHQDHVSGFRGARDKFKQLRVDNVWLAWTEDPDDPLAAKIAKYKGDLGAAAAAGACALAREDRDAASRELGAAAKDILEFAGGVSALGVFAETVNEAMEFLRAGTGARTEYLSPGGKAIEPAFIPGFRFYVLGPPRSETALRDTGEQGSSDLYGMTSGLRAAALAVAGAPADPAVQEQSMPFDARFRLGPKDPLIARSLRGYLAEDESWRRIDSDWLHASAELALQLDELTNNTSLVLAIERISDGKILLFPGDAQEGNWLSWHDPGLKWTVQAGQTAREVTAADLLPCVVFYKVGHHGSHNATGKAKGLELMGRENEMVAFVPVDRAVALTRHPPNCWQMPARPLYRRLLERCQGRVLRSDLGWADDSKSAKDPAVEKDLDGLADKPTWTSWKQAQAKAPVSENPLFFELTI